ncbi:hypothetical protein V8E53_007562 [Lactarius tabidus]
MPLHTSSHKLSQFPSNQAIDSLAKDAYGEATYLWSLLGYDPCEAPIQHKPQPADSVSDSEDLNDDTSEGRDDNTRISDCRELLNAVDASLDSLGHGVPRKNNKQLNEYMFAVAALNLQDLTDFESLPDSDPTLKEDLATHGVRLASTGSGTKSSGHHMSSGASEEQISERRLLAQKIHDIVKAIDDDTEKIGSSTGLNRRMRWTKTPGLYSPSLALSDTTNERKSGNSANAFEVAQKAANLIVKKRRTTFLQAGIPLAEELSTAKVNALTMLQRGSYGIASIDNELMICQVLTMYEKGGGRVARHAWIGECRNIGIISYMVVQLWRQSLGQQCLFKAIHGPSSHLALPRFAHIFSASFLYTLPAGFASRKGDDIEINAFFMDTVFGKLFPSRLSITESVRKLQAKSSSSKDEES